MDATDEIEVRRVIRGILMQILYFALRSVSTAVEMELIATGVVTRRQLPQEPIFAPARRN